MDVNGKARDLQEQAARTSHVRKLGTGYSWGTGVTRSQGHVHRRQMSLSCCRVRWQGTGGMAGVA